jgi:cell division septation protein DedD
MMRNNETGEFELVVGNRQLLSGFFIVVLLFAVSFAMGYVVGQNSPRGGKGQPETASAAPPVSLTPADSRPQQPGAAPRSANPAPAGDGEAPQTTQPAQNAPSGNSPGNTPPAAPEGAPGTYWQVIAVPQVDAEVVARALKEKGFPATMTQGPNNLVRVLVGPYNDTQAMGKAKTELENAGFRPIRK